MQVSLLEHTQLLVWQLCCIHWFSGTYTWSATCADDWLEALRGSFYWLYMNVSVLAGYVRQAEVAWEDRRAGIVSWEEGSQTLEERVCIAILSLSFERPGLDAQV